jgi:hypothetical protein
MFNRDYPKNKPKRVFVHPKKISSEEDNWYLDEFFEEFICGSLVSKRRKKYLQILVGKNLIEGNFTHTVLNCQKSV